MDWGEPTALRDTHTYEFGFVSGDEAAMLRNIAEWVDERPGCRLLALNTWDYDDRDLRGVTFTVQYAA